ncbi:AraC family transcriptional regulator [Rhodococcus sp. KRD162]|uniref:AraC family transcriptional regulator n=1 Tax=Rhodococcus sp. KRD162 TaxID=2729725 RepID=UPI0019D09B60|nr:AraC family transcriptional regulator [Rhodococcus sp. KRD162]
MTPQPTIPAYFIRKAVDLAASGGADLTYPLSMADIATSILDDPTKRLTTEQVTSFTKAVWAMTGDELFGLAAVPVRRGTFRVVCQTLIHTENLSAALTRMSETMRVLIPVQPMMLNRTEDSTVLTVHVHATNDLSAEANELAERLLTDFLLILLHRFAAWLIGNRVKLLSVQLPYEFPGSEAAKMYDAIFGTRVEFGTDRATLEFDNAVMRAPIVQTEDTLAEYLAESPNLLFSSRDYDSTASSQVRRALETGFKGGAPGTEAIAEMLNISPPHLRRVLRQEGTSINQIREEVLRDAAISGLSRGDSVDDISTRLGFSEPSAFRRAFKRWTGQTPSAYR